MPEQRYIYTIYIKHTEQHKVNMLTVRFLQLRSLLGGRQCDEGPKANPRKDRLQCGGNLIATRLQPSNLKKTKLIKLERDTERGRRLKRAGCYLLPLRTERCKVHTLKL